MKMIITATIALAACGGSGMGADVRTDISARMASAKPALDECYKAALKSNRRLKGIITIDLIAEASSGMFKNITIRRDELQSPEVRNCVMTEVGKLKLEIEKSLLHEYVVQLIDIGVRAGYTDISPEPLDDKKAAAG